MNKLLPALLLLTLTACATLTAESDQTITVNTTPAGANCLISNSRISATIEQTPGSITIPRGFEPLSVTCNLANIGSASTTIEAKTRPRAYGNILMFGVPAVVDASTGAGYEYEPDSITLTLGQ